MSDIKTIKFRRGSSTQWVTKNPVLAAGEPGFEIDTGLLKIGDGLSRWNQLDYFVTEDRVQGLIAAAIESAGSGDSGALDALQAHIDSAEPHPIYDDGPSLRLLYENAKV